MEELQRVIYHKMGIRGGANRRVKIKVERSRRLTRLVITLRGTPKKTSPYYQRLLQLFGVEQSADSTDGK